MAGLAVETEGTQALWRRKGQNQDVKGKVLPATTSEVKLTPRIPEHQGRQWAASRLIF
jgi:hypothetical protein